MSDRSNLYAEAFLTLGNCTDIYAPPGEPDQLRSTVAAVPGESGASRWDCTIEGPGEGLLPVRLGLRMVNRQRGSGTERRRRRTAGRRRTSAATGHPVPR